MIIPWQELSADALAALVDEYCIRENGCSDLEEPLLECREQIQHQLRRGNLVILYTPNNPNQVASLVPADRLDERELEAVGDPSDQ